MSVIDDGRNQTSAGLNRPVDRACCRSSASPALLVAVIWFLCTGVANACSYFAWSNAVGLTPADVGDPGSGFARYSGQCSLRVNGPSEYVQDDNPATETAYNARFYVYTGTLANADVFVAYRAAGTEIFRVHYNAGAFSFVVSGAAVQPAAIPAVANRWYSVEVDWRQGAAPGFTAKVQGNGGLVPVSSTATITSSADAVDRVRLGMINAGAGGQGFFDAFESTRGGPIAIGRLCRGDSNNDFGLNGADAQAVIAEVSSAGLSSGQPDCTENGVVSSQDAQCIADLVVAGIGCGSAVLGFLTIFVDSFE